MFGPVSINRGIVMDPLMRRYDNEKRCGRWKQETFPDHKEEAGIKEWRGEEKVQAAAAPFKA